MLGQITQQVQQVDCVLQRAVLVGIELGKQTINVLLRKSRCHEALNHGENIGFDLLKGALLFCGGPQKVKMFVLEKVCIGQDAKNAEHLIREGIQVRKTQNNIGKKN